MTLDELIGSNPDPRELKRALVVKMRQEGWKHHQIQTVLGVQSSFISRWDKRYREQGISGLRLGYQGSSGYLSSEQRQSVIDWIGKESQGNLWEVIEHVESMYSVTYRSLQSYYDLLKSAGMSWHQGQKKAPDTMNLWCSNTTR